VKSIGILYTRSCFEVNSREISILCGLSYRPRIRRVPTIVGDLYRSSASGEQGDV
jgi:hypothetical protein